ncbi:MAG: glycosyltransferase family 39 protein [Candidatus Omnitrophica bacterium]|nr:glycosyltransferase family 39 protein [Candidatus Omnitrophota bacterium]
MDKMNKDKFKIRVIVLLLFFIGLLIRISVVAVSVRDDRYNPYNRLKGDMGSFVASAVSLAQGDGYSDDYIPIIEDFFKDPDHVKPAYPIKPTARKAMGYPLFLAFIFRIIGYHLVPVLYIQAILSAFSTLLIYAIGRQVGSWKTAMIAYILGVFYYPFWYNSIILLSEMLLLFLMLLFFYALIRWFAKPSVIMGFCTGLSAGAAFLVRPIILPIIPLYLLWAFSRFHRQGKMKMFITGSFALILGLIFILAPLAIRNYRLTGRLLLTPTVGGYHLLLTYNPYNVNFMSYNSDPGFITENYPGFRDSLLPNLKINIPASTPPLLAEYLQDQSYGRSAFQFISKNPIQFFKTLPRTFWNIWRIDYPADRLRGKVDNVVLFGSRIPFLLCKINKIIFYGAMIPFFLLGIYIAVSKKNMPALLITTFFSYFVICHTIFASMIRYRIPVMPLFFILSALGLRELWHRYGLFYAKGKGIVMIAERRD